MAEQSAKSGGGWGDKCLAFAIALVIVTALLTLVGFLNPYHYGADLASQFRVQYVVVQLVCLAVFLAFRRWKLAVASIAFASINAALILPLFAEPGRAANAGAGNARLSIIQANVNSRNDSPAELIRYVRQKQPDILLVVELSPLFLTTLCNELPEYKFKISWPDKSASGIGLFSRLPMSGLAIECFGGVPRPNVVGRVHLQDRDVTFVGTHLYAPVNGRNWRQQKEQLAGLGRTGNRLGEHVIVAGDFNSTIWTTQFEQFMQELKLSDTRVGFGTQPTWPTETPIARVPFLGWHRLPLGVLNRVVMLPIDHFLVSRDFVTIKREIGPDIGSDHYPVYLELQLQDGITTPHDE